MINFNFAIRQIAALLCVSTLAWDYFRDPSEIFSNFSIWILIIHFIYFQLPIKSRALAYIHPTSLIGACLIPVMYGYLLYYYPTLELYHMELWNIDKLTVITRACLLHLAPLIFHILDITSNQINLINSYKTKPKKLILIWSLISFPIIGFIFELFYPETDDTSKLQGITRESFLIQNKILCFFPLIISYLSLYLLILRRAYTHKNHNNIKYS